MSGELKQAGADNAADKHQALRAEIGKLKAQASTMTAVEAKELLERALGL